MIAVKNKIWFLREGLFAKYVMALVGLVVFVLAVNGATETWISYRATKAGIVEGMTEKADATARRIDQSMNELERQISRVTSAYVHTVEQRRDAYAQLLGQVPAVAQLSQLDGQGREQLRLSRTQIALSTGIDLGRDPRFTEAVARGVSYSPAYFSGTRPLMSISMAHSGFNAGVTLAEIDLNFLSDMLGDAQVGKNNLAFIVDPRGQVLATSAKGPDIGKDVSALPQVAAMMAKERVPAESGADA